MNIIRPFIHSAVSIFITFAAGFTSAQGGLDPFNPDVNNVVESIAVQPDGKVLIGGAFTIVDGHYRASFARLTPDGRADGTFVPRIAIYGRRIVIQPDDKILVGGIYDPPGPDLETIIRFETNGTVDASFNSPLTYMPFALALQADGKVVAGFQEPPYIARFHPDGNADTTFQAAPDYVVYDLVMQPDGRILVAGYFTKVGGQHHQFLARLHSDGNVDANFNVDIGYVGYNWGVVRRVAVQADGKIVFGGGFTSVNGVPRRNLARVNSDGTLDTQFIADTDGEVHGVVVQPNGRMVVVGDFTLINGQSRMRIARLNWDGSLESSLTAGADRFVRAAALQTDGKVVVGGQFTMLGGEGRRHLGRIEADQGMPPVFVDLFSMRVLVGGAVRFSFFHPNAVPFSVLASDDVAMPLTSWENLGPSVSLGSGIFEFTDRSAGEHPRRFYKLHAP